ncbi:unnamed protein product [Tilletia controversa]|uniref:Cytoplasmic tRNA 2-thiolation protein 2 n=4 Tax=Tilletia TaxID=13289 RepID=A0A8X7SWB0_9BASI|nr:hypothetical protein CF336_g5820 [Tilletia laevis]KAE8246512.1 hypothetical protein A4X06_0g4985 [Tilletia controversa]KAE8256703.1 hypothetical protein A4X03_0g5141 [Tilletia caries]CAD6885867.1 unnamed protein product [Tilletia caries]CAD6908738.1 unnamed protein product [Tilletia laevis]
MADVEKQPDAAASATSVICVRCRTTAATLELPQSGSYCSPCATDIFHVKAKLGLDRARGTCLQYAHRSSGRRKGKAKESEPRDGAAADEKGIAVAFSGSDSSFMLLHAVAQYFLPDGPRAEQEQESGAGAGGAKSKRKKKDTRRMDTVAFLNVLYVDQGALARGPAASDSELEDIYTERVARLRSVVKSVSPSFNFVPLRLEDIFQPDTLPQSDDQRAGKDQSAEYVLCTSPPSSSRYLLPDSPNQTAKETLTPKQALRRLHDAVNPPPAQMPRLSVPAALTRSEDMRRILTQRLLRRAAREQGACALLLGDTASGAAVRFIEAIAKGEGGKAAVEGAPAIWMNDVLVCRPLREILAQEIRFQVQLPGMQSEGSSGGRYLSASSQTSERGSIGRLTNGFIANLESNVSSTVSTVTKTASKIVLDLPPARVRQETEEEAAVSVPDPKTVPQVVQTPDEQLGDDRTGLQTSEARKLKGLQMAFGSAAQRLIRMVEELPRWDELMQDDVAADSDAGTPSSTNSRACPFCGFPSQSEKAHGWKESISILASASSDASDPRQQAKQAPSSDSIELTASLCYGCALVLDTPPPLTRGPILTLAPEAAQLQHMPLPKFVWDAACHLTTRHKATGPQVGHMEVTIQAMREFALGNGALQTTEVPGGEPSRLRKIDQDEMRARIGQFVLPDEP